MNFLAHAVLSFDHPQILTGNMISDFVKGRKKFLYPDNVRKGIELHRMIDQYTDDHEATAAAKQYFRPAYGLYAGPFIDIVYDHFLANDAMVFPTADHLLRFTGTVYQTLDKNHAVLPPLFATLLTYMKADNWLFNYRLITGIHKSFQGLVRRALYMDDAEPAYHILSEHYTALQICYEAFFPDVKRFSQNASRNLLAT